MFFSHAHICFIQHIFASVSLSSFPSIVMQSIGHFDLFPSIGIHSIHWDRSLKDDFPQHQTQKQLSQDLFCVVIAFLFCKSNEKKSFQKSGSICYSKTVALPEFEIKWFLLILFIYHFHFMCLVLDVVMFHLIT